MSRLYRSRRDKKVTGLCGGLAETMNVDATLLRLLVVITTFFTGGTVIFIYVIASMVIPKEPGFDPPVGGPYGNSYATGQGGHGHHGHHGHGHCEGWNWGYKGGKQWNADARHYGSYSANPHQEEKSNIDEVMKDIERKAMQREIEELKAKLASYETNTKTTKGDV